MSTHSTRSSRTERRLVLSSPRQLSDRCTTKKEILRMLVHVKRTRSYRNGERARVERRCSDKITAIDDQIESGRLVLLARNAVGLVLEPRVRLLEPTLLFVRPVRPAHRMADASMRRPAMPRLALV